ncbi:ead/Ea22-like family protein [Pseudomonas sp. PSPC3-3]|uniref:ead/Ea22-like family protein n=1 Tax=unclassified Pseudomonas TaxID=196821 RepID=UPI003CF47012
MADYTELKRMAEAAPEGPWYQHGGIKQVVNHDCETVCETFEEHGDCPTARFIAAANPATVLALIAENEALRKERDNLREDRDGLLEAGAHLL